MNRKQKIIISVTGIFIVMLILVGLTYAYFLTQITGNTKDKSISVTTANLVVRYEDGTNIILDENTKLKPSSNAIGTKIFDVVNEGDEADYVVIVDNISIKNATTGESTTFKTNDFVYTLECVSSDGNDCSDVKTQSSLPLKDESILIGNRMKSGVRHTYTLTLWYLDNGNDQSDDMNKTLEIRVNIEDIRRLENPYAENEDSLAYNIINNSVNTTNGTQLMAAPLTKIAEEISSYGTGQFKNSIATEFDGFYEWDYLSYGETADEANSGVNYIEDLKLDGDVAICNAVKGQHISDNLNCEYDCEYIGYVADCTDDGLPILGTEIAGHEQTLSVTQDDYGTSYYYRGNVQDNYVNFAGMCWRIVRIDGKGNIKIILEDQNTTCNSSTFEGKWSIASGNYGYIRYTDRDIINYLNPSVDKDKAMVNVFKTFQSNLRANIITKYSNKTISDYLASGNWCLGDKAYTRIESSNLYEYTLLESYDYYKNIYYDSDVRLTGENIDGYNPTYKCNGTVMEVFNDSTPMYVATLTADEIVYAGSRIQSYSAQKHEMSLQNYYLINEYMKKDTTRSSRGFVTLSPSHYVSINASRFSSSIFYVSEEGNTSNTTLVYNHDLPIRPAITLKSNIEIEIDGNGTKDNPYVVK